MTNAIHAMSFEQLCRVTVDAVREIFENPEAEVHYQQWLLERYGIEAVEARNKALMVASDERRAAEDAIRERRRNELVEELRKLG